MFIGDPQSEKIQDGWITTNEFSYHYQNDTEYFYVISVPAGFSHDYYSVPKGFKWIIPKEREKKFPAILHDYLYSARGCIDGYCFSKEEVEEIFYQSMIDQGVSRFRAAIIYHAVSIFGWIFWGGRYEDFNDFDDDF